MGDTPERAPEQPTIDSTIDERDRPDAGPMHELPEVARGTEVGRYIVVGRVGAGGMGVVYSAYDPELDRKIALKLLHSETAASSQSTRGSQRLIREARAMAQLMHPNVIAVHDVGTFAERVFIAMEFVDGATLTQWLSEARRSWREVLDVLVPAGQGLAAAHAGGLVHRDFKPDNVMVQTDGRVRVMDFGLARVVPQLRLAERPGRGLVLPTGSDDSPTQGTGVAGTPAYMAPEQYLERTADERSDQFSYCVALYEGLYGERPFAGDSPMAIAFNTTQGQISIPSRVGEVPAWLRRIVLRGLALDPERRFPSMDALLEALSRDRGVRRRRWLGGGIATGLGLAGLGLYYQAEHGRTLCAGANERVAQIWNGERKAQIEAAFLATGVSYAPEAWPEAERWIDDYARGWMAAYRDACEATHVRGEQSPDLLDLRMGCLQTGLGTLSSLADVFAKADAEVVEHAVQAAAGLGGLERCADPAFVSAEIKPPRPEVADRVEQLGTDLVLVGTLEEAGKYADGQKLAERVAIEAEAIGYDPLIARTLLRIGALEVQRGDYQAAKASLARCFWTALELGDEALATNAAVRLTYVDGYWHNKHELAHQWAGYAGAFVARGDRRETAVEADLLEAEGNVFERERDYVSALDRFERAFAIRESRLAKGHPLLARSLNNVGAMLRRLGRYEDALARHQRALDIAERALSPQHPEVAATLSDLGLVRYRQGDLERAFDRHSRALAIRTRSLGVRHPRVASSLNLAGVALRKLGRLDRARAYHERALAILEAALGPDHREVATTLNDLGSVAEHTDDLDNAIAWFERALEIRSATPGTSLAETQFALARVLGRSGRDEARAIELAREARAALRAAVGTDVRLQTSVDEWLEQHPAD